METRVQVHTASRLIWVADKVVWVVWVVVWEAQFILPMQEMVANSSSTSSTAMVATINNLAPLLRPHNTRTNTSSSSSLTDTPRLLPRIFPNISSSISSPVRTTNINSNTTHCSSSRHQLLRAE
jgi:hypothetical protein